MKDVCDYLDSLAEAHVVCEARAEAPLGEEREPGEAALLVVAQRAAQAGRGRQQCEQLVAAQLVDKAAKPAVRLHLFDAQASEATEAERERHGLADGQLLRLRGAERAQRLAQHVAVDLYPPVAEEHERRPLIQQELDFLLRDRFAVHADGQLRRNGRTDRRGRVRGDLGVAQLGGGGHVFAHDAVWQHHRIAGGCEGDRSCLQERFRLCAREVQDAAAQVAERRIDCGGLPERD